MRAMILAAGRGNRMRPLTDHTPKPLLEVAGIPLIVHHLHNLAKAGFREVMINLGHLGEKIEQKLGAGESFNLRLYYSYEDPILETGGGIAKVLSWLESKDETTSASTVSNQGSNPFLVISGDIFTDFPLEGLKLKSSKLAHLVLVDNPDHHPQGDYFLREDGTVCETGSPLYNFAGIGVYRAQLFQDCPKGAFRLPDLFKKAFEHHAISGEYYRGRWVNIGTPQQLIQVNNEIQNSIQADVLTKEERLS
jgi:MurNAc alpha-1-phosphate uridylyltransferase